MWSTVGTTRGRARQAFALHIVLSGVLLACRSAFPLNPNLDINQYAHTAWKTREGFTRGNIQAIAQTPDGYLWLGTDFGLLRFDGVKNVPWQPPAGQHLPSESIGSLLVARDGTLWIGALKGLASWKDGRLTRYPEFADQYIFREGIVEDEEGIIWVGGIGSTTGKLCAIQNGKADCYGRDGRFGRGVTGLFENSKGSLWVGTTDGIWHWKPGTPKFYPLLNQSNGFQALGEDETGTLLIGMRNGISRFVDGRPKPYPLPGVPPFGANEIMRDRDGSLWIGTSDRGLVHLHGGKADVYGSGDGLLTQDVNRLFQDREGDVWAATSSGLERFGDLVASTLTVKQGLSNDLVGAVLAARDGSVWLSTYSGLNQWRNGEITLPHTGTERVDGKLNGHNPQSLFQDSFGRIWIATSYEIGYLENGQVVSLKGIPAGGAVLSMAEDSTGNMWIAKDPIGLFQVFRGKVVHKFSWSSLGHTDNVSVLSPDTLHGGLWLGFHDGGLVYLKDGQVRAEYTAREGLGAGRVNDFRIEQDGTLWASTAGGLSRFKNGRIATLNSKNGLPCDSVHWLAEDDAGSFWVYSACGLLRVARSDLDAWATAVDKNVATKPNLLATVFGNFEGVRLLSDAGHYHPQVAKTPDGRLWFLPWDGVSVVDPRHLPYNKLPPPVHIEQITADHKTYPVSSNASGNVRLPPLIRDLQIDYTALSLVAPEKVLFRYKLEGWDRDWQDAGTRRQAFYSNLPPRDYRFRVMACNNSGVWNEAGASLDFFVAPAYYQSWWFRSFCVAAFLALLAAAYQLRLRQVARQFNMRLEERVNERTRIARELHDTLLQSFQGVLLKFHAVTYVLQDRPEVQKTLETVIDQARQAITEGRDAVQGLRSPTLTTSDIAQAISTFGEELATTPTGQNSPDFHVLVEGVPRDLAPLLRDEIYRITGEALRNAFRHAQAQRIEVEIRYDQRQLRLRVRDDGKGIDPTILNGRGRPGHYGLPGMHERAKLVGGKLAVWSELNSGTEAELSIPASIAYAKSSATRRSTFWGRSA
jgi:ligand-binding sensor domain-containing protein/signal transduction histidine kinase